MVGSRQLFDAVTDYVRRDGDCDTNRSYGDGRSVERRSNPEKQVALARAVECEIIPRLMLIHRLARDRSSRATPDFKSDDNVTILAEMAIARPVDNGIAFLKWLQLCGQPAESLFVDVIGPAARRLGEMWVADEYDFAELTVGFTRLQQMLYSFSPTFENDTERRYSSRCALLLPCPGEQHSLGLFMVQEFFRRAGWQLHGESFNTETDLRETMRTNRLDLVGFSISCEVFIDDLKAAIRTTRKHSKNRSVAIIIGGQLINERPELVAAVGADMTAADGQEAILRLPDLLRLTTENSSPC